MKLLEQSLASTLQDNDSIVMLYLVCNYNQMYKSLTRCQTQPGILLYCLIQASYCYELGIISSTSHVCFRVRVDHGGEGWVKAPPRPLSFTLTIIHPLDTNFFLSPAFCCHKNQKMAAIKYTKKILSTQLLAKIMPPLQASKIAYREQMSHRVLDMWRNSVKCT